MRVHRRPEGSAAPVCVRTRPHLRWGWLGHIFTRTYLLIKASHDVVGPTNRSCETMNSGITDWLCVMTGAGLAALRSVTSIGEVVVVPVGAVPVQMRRGEPGPGAMWPPMGLPVQLWVGCG